ncbi:hypothetical protein HF1_08480 [Mycoplasma haemofelis str. Langford 1]|uniref:Uncharacterized protein n=2 Tax=Mycoplasma haemofelis TaxID=29501 RepID=F6FIY7_MYCHI|nr:hypothetical protein [Mycoplasma haemofelis]AEG73185.1 hypothetical protein MHF_0928 [Mycoplasma haemofelis Ohio2]CBY92856.1 hypothetical protein HF1_08480 [Mycoplasma haemofelis str. Langford 1]
MNPYKALAGVGGIGTAVGGGVLLSKSSIFEDKPTIPKTTIRDRLQRSGYSLNISEENWNTILQEHNKSDRAANIKFSTENLNVSTLKARCSEYLDGEDDNSRYDIAKRWCVEPRKISDFLSSSGLTSLVTNDESAKDKWVKLEEEYRKNQKEKIVGLELQAQKDDNSWKALKDKCGTFLNLKPWENDYEVAMKDTKLWCVDNVVPTQ